MQKFGYFKAHPFTCLRFSRVTKKPEWMNRTVRNIQLPKFPKSVADLFYIKEASNFCFIQSMDIDSINAETRNILSMLWKVVEKLLFNPEAYNKPLNIFLGKFSWAKTHTRNPVHACTRKKRQVHGSVFCRFSFRNVETKMDNQKSKG